MITFFCQRKWIQINRLDNNNEFAGENISIVLLEWLQRISKCFVWWNDCS